MLMNLTGIGGIVIPYERQQRILALLKDRDILKLDDLMELIPDVSESTLRRDIKELESARQIQRLSGGAIKKYEAAIELPMSTKSSLYLDQKKTIARLAAQEAHPEDTVYVDSGSTCALLLDQLSQLDIHIVTSNPEAIRLISSPTKAEIILTGGTFDPEISSVWGPITLENINRFIFDEAFIGANGVDVQFGVTTAHLRESVKKEAAIKRSRCAFVLADSSKLGQVSSVHCADLEQVTIISDTDNAEISERTRIICP